MDVFVNDNCERAIQKFGIATQSIVACEEAGEFIQAVSKAYRNPNDKTVNNLAEECAGLLMMINQLEMYYGLRSKIYAHLHNQNEKLSKILGDGD